VTILEAVAAEWTSAMLAGDWDTLGGLIDPEFVDLSPFPGQEPGKGGFLAKCREYRIVRPDIVASVQRQVASGERVATLTSLLLPAPVTTPKGIKDTFQIADILHVRDGRVVANSHIADSSGVGASVVWSIDGRSAPGNRSVDVATMHASPEAEAPAGPPGSSASLARRWNVAWMTEDLDTLAAMAHPDFVDLGAYPDQLPGITGFLDRCVRYRSSTVGAKYLVGDQVADRDCVVTRYVLQTPQPTSWAHLFPGHKVSGDYLSATIMDFLRFSEGKVVESCYLGDFASFSIQLGLVPG
jgi:predicted ester cyclase